MTVKVYWSEHCVACKTVMAYFAEKRVTVEKINVTHDQEKFDEMLQLGGIATPLIVVGNRIIHSFDRQILDPLVEGLEVE